jgi:3-hydroxyisobutyrate dehydrogenase-like beta-hydroxyacid dehydrogenase
VATIAFIGFGELGSSLAAGLGTHALRAYAPVRRDAAATAALEQRLSRTAVQRTPTIADAVAGSDAVLSVVPARVSRDVAARCAPALQSGSYYVDLAAAALADKQAAAAIIEGAGAFFVDAAVLGTVVTSGAQVPIVASGPGARGFCELVAGAGLTIEAIDAPVGHATRLKLLRSVYMKGRDALILEMMRAARRYGLESQVAQSIQGPGELVPFPALAERVLCSLAVHAERRADELTASGEVVRSAGIEPVISLAGAQVLGALAELGLADSLGGKRPADGGEVLGMIEELTRRPPVP